MDINNIVYITLLVLIVLVPIIFYIISINNAKANISNYLLERGATDVHVSHNWLDADRDTLTFDVVYIGVKGNRKTARCKLHHWGLFVDSELYWADPLSLELVQVERQLPHSEYHELSEKIRAHLPFVLPTYEISTILPIKNSEDQIVMMKYVAAFRNIFRCQPDGSIVWQAELPTASGDVYTNVEWKDRYLTAFSRSCIAVHLDLETGKILPSGGVQGQTAA